MTRSPVSVQLYSVREAVAQDLPRALDRIAGIGFEQVELYDFVDRAAEYERALAAAGLSAPSGHAPVLGYADPRPAFEAAARLGMRTLIDPYYPPEHWQHRTDIAATADRINRLAATAGEFGLAFGYHNHWFEIESRFDGLTGLEVLAEALDPAAVLEVDSFWVQVGGVDAAQLLGRLGDRVTLIHVKDGAISQDVKTQLPAGDGGMDIPAVLAAAPKALRVLEFDDYAGDTFDGLAASLRFVTEHDA